MAIKKQKEFALYKGDKFLKIGTRKELAEYLGVVPHTITFYKSPTWKKKATPNSYIVIDIEDD